MKMRLDRVAVVRLRVSIEVPITQQQAGRLSVAHMPTTLEVERQVVDAMRTKLGLTVRSLAVYENPYSDLTAESAARLDRVRKWQEKRCVKRIEREEMKALAHWAQREEDRA